MQFFCVVNIVLEIPVAHSSYTCDSQKYPCVFCQWTLTVNKYVHIIWIMWTWRIDMVFMLRWSRGATSKWNQSNGSVLSWIRLKVFVCCKMVHGLHLYSLSTLKLSTIASFIHSHSHSQLLAEVAMRGSKLLTHSYTFIHWWGSHHFCIFGVAAIRNKYPLHGRQPQWCKRVWR